MKRIAENEPLIFKSTHGPVEGYEGDSVAITFVKSGNIHSPVMSGIAKTITTFCDHDQGVIVYESEEDS